MLGMFSSQHELNDFISEELLFTLGLHTSVLRDTRRKKTFPRSNRPKVLA